MFKKKKHTHTLLVTENVQTKRPGSQTHKVTDTNTRAINVPDVFLKFKYNFHIFFLANTQLMSHVTKRHMIGQEYGSISQYEKQK